MNTKLAEENLQTIRMLMERSALYRRALAPIMLLAGILGMCAAFIGLRIGIEGGPAFSLLWLSTACIVVVCAFLLARRQAFKDAEPFWSPPTLRVAHALLPPLLAGMVLGALQSRWSPFQPANFGLALIWLLFYGCALHSAGFFMVRGIRWFAWIFIAGGIFLLVYGHYLRIRWGPPSSEIWLLPVRPNIIMGLFFGVFHLLYGIYLYFTEKKVSAV